MSQPSVEVIHKLRQEPGLDPTTKRLLELREKGWFYFGLRSYCRAEYRWLREKEEYRAMASLFWTLLYALRFLFR